MPTIAICDDEPQEVQKILSAAKEFLRSRSIADVALEGFSDAGSFLSFFEGNTEAAVTLLDICMPGVSGIQIARRLREKNASVKIIFLTSSAEFAVEAFTLNASHYLLKPFTQEQFDQAMERCLEALKEKPEAKQISIHGQGESVTMLDISDISCIESVGRRRYVRSKRGEFVETRRTLSQFSDELEALCPGQFISPYRGYIVNLSAVSTLTAQNLVMKDGTRILIKPGDFRRLKDILFAHTFRK